MPGTIDTDGEVSVLDQPEPMVGTSMDDFMFGGYNIQAPGSLIWISSNSMFGNSGDDFIIGDFGFFFYTDTILLGLNFETALYVDNPSYHWSVDENPLFEDSSVPHATWVMLIGSWIRFSATEGATITLDVDYGSSVIGHPTDTTLSIYDAARTLLAFNDNAPITAGGLGSSSPLDAFLTFTAPATATYYVNVGSARFGTMLNISMPGHAVGPSAPHGNDALIGDDGDDELFGMGGDDVVDGGNGDDLVHGGSGEDTLRGGPGADRLTGDLGNDVLSGNEGADTLWGGPGNDVFYVEDAADAVYDLSGGGFDRLAALVSYSLAAGAEIELLEAVNLTDTAALGLNGNEYINTIIGNAGANRLDGGGGNDRLFGVDGNDLLIGGPGYDEMHGGDGNDVYYVDSDFDAVVEIAGHGADRVSSTGSYTLAAEADVETLEATDFAAAYALTLTGNGSNNRIIGNSGANWLDGKGGSDVLVGAGGADVFAFTHALGSGNVDTIEGFQVGLDKIALDDAILADLNPGSMDPNRFVVGAAARDADDRVIYDPGTGALWFDADGNGGGAAVQIAWLTPGPSLTSSDVMII